MPINKGNESSPFFGGWEIISYAHEFNKYICIQVFFKGHVRVDQGSLFHLKILQFMEQPLADGLVMSLTCMAFLSHIKHDSFVHFDITWSGIGIDQHSVWLRQSNATQQGNKIVNKLVFRPLLASHAGEYTCYLVKNNTVVASRSITVSGM